MKVRSDSWHYRFVQWLQPESEKRKPMSVCGYAGTVAFGPLFVAIASAFIAAASPIIFIIWLFGDFLPRQKWWPKPKLSCPFGNVEVIEKP